MGTEKETIEYFRVEKIIPDKNVFSHYDPISLTEEWLLKFGFENQFGIWQDSSGFTLEYGESNYDRGKGWRYGFFSFKIKSVHQLQNLYFALTGKELTIKTTVV